MTADAFDVVVLGDDPAGSEVADAATRAGLSAFIVAPAINGTGFVAGPNRVAVLDPKTGDETRVLQAGVIVVAVPESTFLGLGKLGVEMDKDARIITDASGQTICPGIFAVGTCAASPGGTPLVKAVSDAVIAKIAVSGQKA